MASDKKVDIEGGDEKVTKIFNKQDFPAMGPCVEQCTCIAKVITVTN